MRLNRWLLAAIVLPTTSALTAWISFASVRTPPVTETPPAVPAAALPPVKPAVPARVVDTSVGKGYTFSQTLKDLGMLKDERAALMDSMHPYIDAARVDAGTRLKVRYARPEDELPTRIEVRLDNTRTLLCDRQGVRAWTTAMQETPLEKRIAAYTGVVKSTLWNSATTAGMDPQLITRLAELFSYQVDFHRGVHEEDRWRLTVERLYAEGNPVGYGDIVAAEYDDGDQTYSAVRFDDGTTSSYYAPDGASLRRLFLKSPLRYARITSGFSSQRFHPILKVNRAHLGIDYGAPTGTPIMAVGDGVVTFAANHGDSGKMITIKHNGQYQTFYKHLSAYAKDLQTGTKVKSGQVIGYVGATGLATGPHLHFEFHVGSKVVDPRSLKFPSADPVPAAGLAAFRAAAAKELGELPPWGKHVAMAHGSQANAE